LEARFAKWILMTDDRAQDGVLSLTHQTMAIMLGAHRTRVTAMARKFQDTGSIRYSRGRLMVQDRAKLKAIACTCYGADKDILADTFDSRNHMPAMMHALPCYVAS
jgi:hypothetical protein